MYEKSLWKFKLDVDDDDDDHGNIRKVEQL